MSGFPAKSGLLPRCAIRGHFRHFLSLWLWRDSLKIFNVSKCSLFPRHQESVINVRLPSLLREANHSSVKTPMREREREMTGSHVFLSLRRWKVLSTVPRHWCACVFLYSKRMLVSVMLVTKNPVCPEASRKALLCLLTIQWSQLL